MITYRNSSGDDNCLPGENSDKLKSHSLHLHKNNDGDKIIIINSTVTGNNYKNDKNVIRIHMCTLVLIPVD